mgnify:FL=1
MDNYNESGMYNLVSKTAYLLGVDREDYFMNYKDEIFEEMENIPEAKILRIMSKFRTALLNNYKEISQKIIYDLKNLDSLPDYFSQKDFRFLRSHGVEIVKVNTKAEDYIYYITKEITNYTGKVIPKVYPIWVNHEYVKELFAMKCSRPKDGFAVVKSFASKRNLYPYHIYINLSTIALTNDKAFTDCIYAAHGKSFNDSSKVINRSANFSVGFESFFEAAGDIYILVDCENTNVYKLYCMLLGIKEKFKDGFSKIRKICLYDDIHTTNAWKLLHRFTEIKIEHNLIERVVENKSLVDIQLSTGACKAYYEDKIKDFILVSSDSDFFGLINSLPLCNFQVAVEKDNVSDQVLDAMDDIETAYCYMDDFYSGSLEPLYEAALKLEINDFLSTKTTIQLHKLFASAAKNARIDISDKELEVYLSKYAKSIHIERNADNLYLAI